VTQAALVHDSLQQAAKSKSRKLGENQNGAHE
jgi:hypothetical protein